MDRKPSYNPYKLSRSQSFNVGKNKLSKSGPLNPKFNKYGVMKVSADARTKTNTASNKQAKCVCMKKCKLKKSHKIILVVGVIVAIILAAILSVWINFTYIKDDLDDIYIEPYPKDMKYPNYKYKEIEKE
uniref:Uncharacterized protein n=1 Tax=Theileria annulata TaxID=5874 RepID=A0A3B0N6Z0_THEAN